MPQNCTFIFQICDVRGCRHISPACASPDGFCLQAIQERQEEISELKSMAVQQQQQMEALLQQATVGSSSSKINLFPLNNQNPTSAIPTG